MFKSFIDYSNNKDLKTLKLLFYQNLEYFYNNNLGTLIFLINEKVQYNYSAKHFLNYLCSLSLTSTNAYNNALKKLFKYSYNNPVLINNLSIIIGGNINKFETIYFNLRNVTDIKELNNKQTLITFKSGRSIVINKNINFLSNQTIKLEKLKRYLI